MKLDVYVKNGKIRLKSETRMKAPGCHEYKTDHKMTDRLIYEGGEVKIYEQSKQYGEDINRYHLQRELQKTKKENAELTIIDNAKMERDLELKTNGQKADKYNKNIYLLKNMRC